MTLKINPKPTFYIRNIPIYGDKILSPMAGFSDMPFRSICREYGSAMSYTEFVPVEAIIHTHPNALTRLTYDPAERPITMQIFGCDLDLIEQAAHQIEAMQPDILDINMGCPSKKVAGRGAGVGLMKTPQKVAQIFQRLTTILTIPITAKIRMGWDENSLNYLEIGKILEDNGVATIAIHGRTKVQAYKGTANWDAIAALKQAVSVPVIGNGDVKQVADIARMKAYTGCDAVMIGRAAIGNPWIFAGKDFDEVTLTDRAALIRRHLKKMTAFYGQERGLILFRKHVVKYTKGLSHSARVRDRLVRCTEVEEFIDLVAEFEASQEILRAEAA